MCSISAHTDSDYPTLIQLPTKALPLSRCESKDYPANAETDVCVASISPKEGYGICRPWGGNALIGWRDTPARSQLLGLESGFFCVQSNQRKIYLRVAPYVPWILNTMKPKSSSSKYGFRSLIHCKSRCSEDVINHAFPPKTAENYHLDSVTVTEHTSESIAKPTLWSQHVCRQCTPSEGRITKLMHSSIRVGGSLSHAFEKGGL